VGVSLKSMLVCMIVLCLPGAARAETWQAVCVNVLDGDSLVVAHEGVQTEIRLYGIDAPEYDQTFGRQARACTRSLALKKQVRVEPVGIDKYGRTVARIYAPEGCVNELLVARGCAWVFTRFCSPEDLKTLEPLEQGARGQRLGLWAWRDPVPPWEYRARAQSHRQKTAPATGPFHGNTGSRIFHAPGCKYYSCRHCTAVFNSIGEALRAGYRPCKRCIGK